MNEFERAFEAWTELLGKERAVRQTDQLLEAQTTTFATDQQVLAVLYPNNAQEVADILRLAQTFEVPVYPISRGKNWGLGSKVPVQDRSVVIDLGRMNAISRLDREMATVTVEPGVSFRQLFDYLETHAPELMLDSVASTENASVIGNTMERGQGMGLYVERFNHVCGFEVVLPTGEVINTGFERYENSVLGPLHKWGVGPYIDGLFTQSNLGIVTRMNLWLKPKPKVFQAFVFHVDTDAAAGPVTDTFRQLRLQGLQTSLRIFNDYRLISTTMQYPFDRSNGQTPMPPDLKQSIKEQLNLGDWIGIGGLYSWSEEHAALEREQITRAVDGQVSRLEFIHPGNIDQLMESDAMPPQQLDFLYRQSMLRGFTTDKVTDICYWRKKQGISEDRDVHADRCGMIWFCPSLPASGPAITRFIEISNHVFDRYSFEPNIGFLFTAERVLDVTGAILYDRDVAGEDQRAMQCHDELMAAYTEAGFSPYRLGVQSMDLIPSGTDESSLRFLQGLKRSLDPANILAPGRYIPKA